MTKTGVWLAGLQPQLASFFKAPLGVEEHDLSRQFKLLDRYVERHANEVVHK